jgi:hypothetical protein
MALKMKITLCLGEVLSVCLSGDLLRGNNNMKLFSVVILFYGPIDAVGYGLKLFPYRFNLCPIFTKFIK